MTCEPSSFFTTLGEEYGNDYDFVLHTSEVPIGVSLESCLDLRKYIKVMPLGNSYLYKGIQGIDLLIYEDERDIRCMKAVTLKLRQIANEFPFMHSYLMNKDRRVKLFEHALMCAKHLLKDKGVK